jgi:KaiC/GvpD/RAD55 family RecA-like ATPase
MYSVGDTLPVDDLDSGSYLLAGPAMSGKYDLLLSFIAEGIESGDGALFVSTNEDAGGVIGDVEDRMGAVPDHFRLVDCVSERGGGDALPADRVEYVSSPGDLTGIGIGVSEQLRRFDESTVEQTRLAFYSLSTLLMYAELETVFRFLHVLTGRIGSIDAVGVFAVDPTTHDESTVNTLKQLFDGMIELRETEGGREVRLVGVDGGPTEWMPQQ